MKHNNPVTSNSKYSEWIYYLFFGLMFGARAAGLDEGNTVYSIVFVVSMILFLIKIAATEHTVREYAWMGLLLLLALAVYYRTGEKGLLLCFAMMLGMKGVPVKNVFRIGALILAFFFSLNVFLSVFGFKNELFYYQERVGMGGDFRHALGYPHPNSLQLNCFILVMLTMFLIRKESKRRMIVASCIMLLLSLYIFMYSGSRTGLLITVFYLFANYYLLYRSDFSALEKSVIQLVYPACAAAGVLIPFAGSRRLIDWFSVHMDTIGSRVRDARYYFDQTPVTVLGSRIVITKDFAYGIDIAYAYLFLVLGIAAFVIFSVLYIGLIHYCLKTDRRSELAVTLSIVLMGTLEPFLFNLSFKNLSLIFLGQYLYVLSANSQEKILKNSAFLNRHILISGWDRKCVSENRIIAQMIERLRRWYNNITEMCFDPVKIRRSLLLFTTSAALIFVIGFCAAKHPSALYLDSDRTERSNIGMNPIYLSEQEAKTITEKGDILIHYQGADIPMYKYEGMVVMHEYFRRLISLSIWCSLIVLLLYNVYADIYRKKRLRRG